MDYYIDDGPDKIYEIKILVTPSRLSLFVGKELHATAKKVTAVFQSYFEVGNWHCVYC